LKPVLIRQKTLNITANKKQVAVKPIGGDIPNPISKEITPKRMNKKLNGAIIISHHKIETKNFIFFS